MYNLSVETLFVNYCDLLFNTLSQYGSAAFRHHKYTQIHTNTCT